MSPSNCDQVGAPRMRFVREQQFAGLGNRSAMSMVQPGGRPKLAPDALVMQVGFASDFRLSFGRTYAARRT